MLGLPIISSVTLEELPNLFAFDFPHSKNKDKNSNAFMESLELDEMM